MIQSSYISMCLFILQHHYVVRMGCQPTTWPFSAKLTFNSSLSCLQSFSVLSKFSRWFWILIPPFNMLATSPASAYNTALSLFPLLHILPEIDHKAVTKSLLCICILQSNNCCLCSFFFAVPLQKIKTKTQSDLLVCLFFKKKTTQYFYCKHW